MRCLVLGVVEMKGVSQKTKAAYEMRRLIIGSPVGPAQKEHYTRRASGVEGTELECDEATVIAALALSFPVVCDVETDMRPLGGRLVPVATGIKAVAAQVRAAA